MKRGPKPEPVIDRFNRCFDVGKDDECWEWKARLTRYGYGAFWVGRHVEIQRVDAHRFMYSFRFGEVPAHLQVCHHCDNRKCVNPNHLFLGDHKANAEDRERKGRGWHPKGFRAPWNSGTRNGMSRLSEGDLSRIRAMLAMGVQQSKIADEFRVSRAAITLIKQGKTYNDRAIAQLVERQTHNLEVAVSNTAPATLR